MDRERQEQDGLIVIILFRKYVLIAEGGLWLVSLATLLFVSPALVWPGSEAPVLGPLLSFSVPIMIIALAIWGFGCMLLWRFRLQLGQHGVPLSAQIFGLTAIVGLVGIGLSELLLFQSGPNNDAGGFLVAFGIGPVLVGCAAWLFISGVWLTIDLIRKPK